MSVHQDNVVILKQMRRDTAELGMLAHQLQDNRMPEFEELIANLDKHIRWALDGTDG